MVLPTVRRKLQIDDLSVDGISDEGDIIPASTAPPTSPATSRRTLLPRQTRPPMTTNHQSPSPVPTTDPTLNSPRPTTAPSSPTSEPPSTPRATTLLPTTVSTAPTTTASTPTTTSSPVSSTLLPTTTSALITTSAPITTTAPTTTTTPTPTTTMTTMPTPKQSPSGSMLLLPPEYGTWGSSSPPPASLPPDAMLAAESTGDHPSTLQSLPFPASAIVAMVAGILAVLVTAGVVAYYRHRYRQMSLQYLRNMQSTAWTFDDTTVDNDSHAPSGPPRSPSMSIWTNPNRPASEFSSGFKSQWQRHAVPSPRSMTDYQSRRARLPSLQTEVNHDALRHNGWHHAASNVSGASKPPVVSSGHAMPGSIESLSRLEPAQRMHLNRQGHNLVYDTHHASYTSAYDHECNSAISCKSSGEESTPRPKRSTRGETKLSMSSWDEP